MKRLFLIILAAIFVLAGLSLTRVKPTREVFGFFACDCAETSCSKMIELTPSLVGIDTVTFCKDRKFGGLLKVQPQLQIHRKMGQTFEDHMLTVPVVMLLDPRTVFGCPDCLDQGGTYFEFQWLGFTRHFEIDNGSEPIYFKNLSREISKHIAEVDNGITSYGR